MLLLLLLCRWRRRKASRNARSALVSNNNIYRGTTTATTTYSPTAHTRLPRPIGGFRECGSVLLLLLCGGGPAHRSSARSRAVRLRLLRLL